MPIPVCPRVKVATLGDLIPVKFRETLEHNQMIASCCRHPEDHDIEAFKTKEQDEAPDVYIFYCTCGKQHIRWICRGGIRPMWDVR